MEAGRALAAALQSYARRPNLLILALPRGGVPVGFEVARALHAPLDVMLVRKLGVPEHEELAMGAIASGGIRVISNDVVEAYGISDREIATVAAVEEKELQRREQLYRGGRPQPTIRGRTIILVDDGLATGATMRAAVAALKVQEPDRVVVAVPIGASETCRLLRAEADDVVCLYTPEPFYAVGMWYHSFSQMGDDEVRDLLRRAAALQPA